MAVLNRALGCFFVILVFMSICCSALAQSKESAACKSVPEGLADISAALNICADVGELTQQQVLLPGEQLERFQNAVRLSAAGGLQDIGRAKGVEQDLDSQKRGNATRWLKISAAIIGGVGGGGGGLLRLNHDASVQRDGTILSMAAGFAGAGVNLFGVLCIPCNKNPEALIPKSVQAYIQNTHPKVKIATFRRHPAQLSPLLIEMQAQTEALQQELNLQ